LPGESAGFLSAAFPMTESTHFADLLFRVARCLLQRPASIAPAEALALIGPAFDADRAWLIRLDEELQNFWVAYEWCAEGVQDFLPDFPCVPTALIALPMRDFLKDRPVVMEEIEALPPDAQALKEEMRREGNRATAGVPVFREGKLVALVGLDDVRKTHAWSAAEMAELRTLAELLVTAADRVSGLAETPEEAAQTARRPESGGCYLRAGNCHVQARWEEVLTISADGDHSRVRLASGREFFELKALTVWEAMLPAERFLRVHRSHIVNWTQVQRVRRTSGGRWSLEMRGGGPTVPVGRSYQEAVKNRIHLRGVRE
jgi:hypothetical protein